MVIFYNGPCSSGRDTWGDHGGMGLPPRQIALTPMTYSYCFPSARVLLLLLSWSWDHYSQESLDIKGVIVSILQVKMLKHRKAKKLPIGGSSWSDRVWCQPSRCVSDLCVISHRAVLFPSNGTGHRQRDSSGNLGQTVFWIVKNQKEPSLQQDIGYLI